MSNNDENKNKSPLEIISNLLSKLLDTKLIKLETKNKDEMSKIESISQNTEVIINELQAINKKIKPKAQIRKSILKIYHPSNHFKKNNINKYTTKLNTSSIISKNYNRTPDRIYYSKIKTVRTNDIKRLKHNKSEIFFPHFLCDKNNNSKILTNTKRDSKIFKRSRDLTPAPSTPNMITRKKGKGRHKPSFSNVNSLKHSNNLFNKNFNKSCKFLPNLKKDKTNVSKLSKNDELDLLCQSTMHDEDRRIYDLSPVLKHEKNKKRSEKNTSVLFNRTSEDFHKQDENKELTLDDSTLNDVNKDEVLIYFHNKKSTRLIEDINLSKSFIGDSINDELNLEINFEESNSNYLNKNNNYTLAERLENSIDYFSKYLTKAEFLQINLINKECFRMIMHHLIFKTEDNLDDVKESLLILKKNYNNIFDKIDEKNNFWAKPFELNKNSERAIALLNSIPIEKIFLNEESPIFNNKYIVLAFDLFFITLGYKKQISNFKNDSKSKLNFYKNIFEKCGDKSFGISISKLIKGIKFDNDIINSLYEYSHNYINNITPSYFHKINNDIGLFVFVVKNILEYVGIAKEANNKKNVTKLYLLYNARISINSTILEKLNKINSIISNKK